MKSERIESDRTNGDERSSERSNGLPVNHTTCHAVRIFAYICQLMANMSETLIELTEIIVGAISAFSLFQAHFIHVKIDVVQLPGGTIRCVDLFAIISCNPVVVSVSTKKAFLLTNKTFAGTNTHTHTEILKSKIN